MLPGSPISTALHALWPARARRGGINADGLNIYQRLLLIAVLVALPLLLLSAAIVWRLAERERAMSHQALVYSARSVTSAVDAELGKYAAAAEALAAAPSLRTGDLAAFREEAGRVFPDPADAWVLIADVHGQQVVNTFVPASQPLPRLIPDVFQDEVRAFATRRLQVSNVAFGPVARQAVVGVGVPVFRAGQPAYFLMVVFRAAAFRDLLNAQNMPPGWLAAVIDRNGNFVARSRDDERLAAKPAAPGFRAIQRRNGVFEYVSLGGAMLIHANVVSPLSGWAIGVATAKSALEGPIRQTMAVAAVAGLAVLLCSFLFAAWAARRIAGPIRSLKAAAEQLRLHRPVAFAATGVPEVDEAVRAFESASEELRAHDRHRIDNEQLWKSSAERLRLFIEQAPASIAMFDRDMRFLAASHRWLSQFSPREQDVIGRPYYEVMPDIPHHWKVRHGRVLNGETAGVNEEAFVRSDGRVQWVSSETRPWRGADGTIGGIVIFKDDVTARHEAEEARRTLQAELLRVSRLSESGQMAAALAHELNQPLAAVTSYIGGCRRILRSARIDDDLRQRLLGVMEQAGAQALRAGDVIRRLREFIGGSQTEKTIEKASNVISESIALACVAATHGGASIHSEIGAAGNVLVNKIQIQQVFINLVRNAIEAMETSARKELHISLSQQRGDVQVDVSDTGSGLSPQIKERLFEPFASTKRGGMGIGLSISREIIEAHGGRIWAEGNPDGGTVFRFTLPLVGQVP